MINNVDKSYNIVLPTELYKRRSVINCIHMHIPIIIMTTITLNIPLMLLLCITTCACVSLNQSEIDIRLKTSDKINIGAGCNITISDEFVHDKRLWHPCHPEGAYCYANYIQLPCLICQVTGSCILTTNPKPPPGIIPTSIIHSLFVMMIVLYQLIIPCYKSPIRPGLV